MTDLVDSFSCKGLVSSLKNSHFIYDFGNGVSKPIHYVHRDSSGRWHLALPYSKEETGKYIAGQKEESGNIRFYVSKSDINFATIDEMAEWCVQQDRSIVYRLSQNNDVFKVDYETIISLRNKRRQLPTSILFSMQLVWDSSMF